MGAGATEMALFYLMGSRRNLRILSEMRAAIWFLLFVVAFAGAPQLANGAVNASFPQSVASGDPSPSSVTLWSRVELGRRETQREVIVVWTASGPKNVGGFEDLTEGDGGSSVFEFLNNGEILIQEDAQFATRRLTAQAAYDGCLKTTLSGLEPDTSYYYQFVFNDDGQPARSAIGRTKTAPGLDDARPIRFASLNGSDYSGRYFNTLAHLNQTERASLDFVVHLGDYIYETSADLRFLPPGSDRLSSFASPKDAINLGSFEGARTLENYRDLYKLYRQDPNLVESHELFPWVVIWDDREFSEDHYGATATYSNGVADETDVERKHAAEQAWMEFIPSSVGMDPEGVGLSIDASILYPNTRIYRSLNFGPNLDLILSDTRSFRPDHLVREDAYPGTVLVEESALEAIVEAGSGPGTFPFVRDQFDPYFNLDEPISVFGAPAEVYNDPHPAFEDTVFRFNTFAEVVAGFSNTAAGQELFAASALHVPRITSAQYAAEEVRGNLSATWVNLLMEGAGFPPPFSPEQLAAMPRGISVLTLGKTATFSAIGSRSQIVDPTFQIYAAASYQAFLLSGGFAGKDQSFLGPQQEAFLGQSLLESALSGTRWRVVASSTPFTPLVLKLSDVPEDVSLPSLGIVRGENVGEQIVPQGIPAEFTADTLIDADQLSGFPFYRGGIVDALAAANAVVISGDVDASLLGLNRSSDGRIVPDFTAPASSSGVFRRAIQGVLALFEGLLTPGYQEAFLDRTAQFTFLDGQGLIDGFDRVLTHSSPDLMYANTDAHGYVVMTASPTELVGEFREISSQNVFFDRSSDPLDALVTRKPYVVTQSLEGLSVRKEPEIVALTQSRGRKVGNSMGYGGIPTEAGRTYQAQFSASITGPWSPAALVAIDGQPAISASSFVGTGAPANIAVEVPAGVVEPQQAFFRVVAID